VNEASNDNAPALVREYRGRNRLVVDKQAATRIW
jgi:hypothetical protein